MFKNLTPCRLGQPGDTSLALSATFAPCGPTQPVSVGFVPPREDHGALVETVVGQTILAVQVQTRTVPGSEVKRHVKDAAAEIERTTGRKPGKKQCAALKDEALLALMPQAFPRTTKVFVWVDRQRNRVVLGTASAKAYDRVTTLLAQALGMQVLPVYTEVSPGTLMGAWLADEDNDRDGLTLGAECELRQRGNSAARVAYRNLNVATDEVRDRLRSGGFNASRCALDYQGRVSFVLTDDMTLRKVELLQSATVKGADAFDANVAILTGEIAPLLDDLVQALGGEIDS